VPRRAKRKERKSWGKKEGFLYLPRRPWSDRMDDPIWVQCCVTGEGKNTHTLTHTHSGNGENDRRPANSDIVEEEKRKTLGLFLPDSLLSHLHLF